MSGSARDALGSLLDEEIRSSTPTWIELLRAFVRVPSAFGQEHALVDLVAHHVRSLGVVPHRVSHDAHRLRALPASQPPYSDVPDRYSLAVRLKGTGRGRSLALNAHLDIVPAGESTAWEYPPFEATLDSAHNVLYGRGAMDDKAGAVILLAVLELVSKFQLRLEGDLVFQFVIEDETTGNGSLLCLEAGHGADAALILDGTRPDRAIREHAGNLQFSIRLRGKPVSISVAHMGVNAAELLWRLGGHLKERFLRLNESRKDPWTRFPSPYQVVVRRFHSDSETFTLPEYAQADFHATFPPPLVLSEARRFFESEVGAFAISNALPFPPELTWGPLQVEPVGSRSVDLETALLDTARSLHWPSIEIGPSTGISDMRHFTDRGIPCLLYGPGRGFNPHRPNEHYFLDDLPRMVRFITEFIGRWCGLS